MYRFDPASSQATQWALLVYPNTWVESQCEARYSLQLSYKSPSK